MQQMRRVTADDPDLEPPLPRRHHAARETDFRRFLHGVSGRAWRCRWRLVGLSSRAADKTNALLETRGPAEHLPGFNACLGLPAPGSARGGGTHGPRHEPPVVDPERGSSSSVQNDGDVGHGALKPRSVESDQPSATKFRKSKGCKISPRRKPAEQNFIYQTGGGHPIKAGRMPWRFKCPRVCVPSVWRCEAACKGALRANTSPP
ncbi:unnamed protein product [Lampetra planeri]